MNAQKGFFTESGYMGYIANRNEYIRFASEDDYYEYLSQEE